MLAADSLSTRGETITSCTTVKLHQIGQEAVTAGSGLSRVMGQDWRTVLQGFPSLPAEAAFNEVLVELQSFLDRAIDRIPRQNVGATQGGNTFLLAGHDALGPGMAVAKLIRKGIDRQFQKPTVDSPASLPGFIDWIGDRAPIEDYISERSALYASDMSETDAVAFAVAAIKDGIRASVRAGNRTIGGDFISVAVVKAGDVTISKKPSGIPCAVDPSTVQEAVPPS